MAFILFAHTFQSSDGFTKIQEGSEVRLRIVGTKMDQSDIVSKLVFALSRSGVAALGPKLEIDEFQVGLH